MWARVASGVTVFSCYVSPNVSTGEYELVLAARVRTAGGKIMVDFNGKTREWGNEYADKSGLGS